MHNIIHKRNFDNQRDDISVHQPKKGVTKKHGLCQNGTTLTTSGWKSTVDGGLAWKMLYHKYL